MGFTNLQEKLKKSVSKIMSPNKDFSESIYLDQKCRKMASMQLSRSINYWLQKMKSFYQIDFKYLKTSIRQSSMHKAILNIGHDIIHHPAILFCVVAASVGFVTIDALTICGGCEGVHCGQRGYNN